MTAEEPEQIAAAARVILGILRLQTEMPGSITSDDLPDFVLMAADEREKHGDFGAARLLEEWADMLARPLKEWD
ncbi:hypothetical protein [Paracoccus sp. PAR01]|uniref:hypothetical protein n=1 Tax=Paracoccus sp. PAR01 TaxID=2769282 RepID=UPI00177B4507|nr:hypothetical protein [Paracoccus sp. PAR01]MBD9528408.1 hypothetical protein [Paracoccus sp. PAR01]